MKTVDIFGVSIVATPLDDVHGWIRQRLEHGEKTVIVTPNPEILLRAQQDEEFRNILSRADLAIPDGAGLLVASDILRPSPRRGWLLAWSVAIGRVALSYYKRLIRVTSPIPERIAGSDLTQWLIEISAARGLSVGLIGGAAGVAKRAAREVKKKYPTLTIVSHHGGSGSPKEDQEIRTWVSQNHLDVLFIAFGAPKQERWMDRNNNELPRVRLMMGVGGTVDFLAGTKKRAPRWMRAIGLEWLFRVIQEPSRIIRIWNAVIRWTCLVAVRAATLIHQSGISG